MLLPIGLLAKSLQQAPHLSHGARVTRVCTREQGRAYVLVPLEYLSSALLEYKVRYYDVDMELRFLLGLALVAASLGNTVDVKVCTESL